LRLAFALIALGLSADIAHGNLVVSAWDLYVFVNPNEGNSNGAGFGQVQNPFVGTATASIPPTVVSAEFQASWVADSFLFSLDTTQHAETFQGSVTTAGFIHLTPMVDSILTINASMDYDLPQQPARAALAISVGWFDPAQILYGNSQVQTNFLGPASGTFVVDSDQVFLPGGQPWRLQWGFHLDHFDPPIPGAASDAGGMLTFTIQPVPEPATALGVLAAAVFLRRRRHR
jgi:hypothetical protein